MRFSILIPVYNTGKYLNDCMDSVLRQSFTDFEVILVDDGSTDSTGEMCDSYKDARVHVIHQENQGLLMARRTGIAQAKGEFCVFLDSDDALADGALQSIHDRLEKTGADMLIYNTALVCNDDFTDPRPRTRVFPQDRVFDGEQEKALIYEKLLTGFELNNLVLKAIRRPLVQQDDTDYEAIKDNSMGEDLLQSLYPVTHAKRIAYTGDCYYYYRQSTDGMTRYIDPAKLERRFAGYNPNALTARIRYAKIWGLWNEKRMYQIYRNALLSVRLLFNSVFFHCEDGAVRKKWCAFPWETLLPPQVMAVQDHKQIGLDFFARIQLKGIFEHRYLLLRLLAAIQRLKR